MPQTSTKVPDRLILLRPDIIKDLETTAQRDFAAGARESKDITEAEVTAAKENSANVVVYLIDIPTDLSRARWRQEMKSIGGRVWSKADMIASAREAIELAAPDTAEGWLSVCDRYEAMTDDTPQEEASEILAAWVELAGALYRSGGEFAKRTAANEFWGEMGPRTAARMFLLGTAEERFKRGPDGLIPEARMNQLPELDRMLIGLRALNLFSPSEAEAKNSASPQPSPSGPANSTAASNLPTAATGTSSETGTSATQA